MRLMNPNVEQYETVLTRISVNITFCDLYYLLVKFHECITYLPRMSCYVSNANKNTYIHMRLVYSNWVKYVLFYSPYEAL